MFQAASAPTKHPFLRQHTVHSCLCLQPPLVISAIESGEKTQQRQSNSYAPQKSTPPPQKTHSFMRKMKWFWWRCYPVPF